MTRRRTDSQHNKPQRGPRPRVSATASPRRLLAALPSTPQEAAAATGVPEKAARRALLQMYRSGRVERLLTNGGVLYAPIKETDR